MDTDDIGKEIAIERIRQARYSFNLALVVTAAFAGLGLFLNGASIEGAIFATGGTAASVRCFQIAKDANDRLDMLRKEKREKDGKE